MRLGSELFFTSFPRCSPLEHCANGKHRGKDVRVIYPEQSKFGFNFQNGQGFPVISVYARAFRWSLVGKTESIAGTALINTCRSNNQF